MIRKYLGVLGVAGVICITGCASHNIEATAPEPRRLGKDIPSFRAADDPETSSIPDVSIEEPTSGLALQEALALALMRNPELAVFSWEVRAREAEAVQAGVFPNPEAAVEIENFGGSGELEGFGAAETTVGLFQLIELGGKRGKRRHEAEWLTQAGEWDYETKRLDVLTDVTVAFVDLLVAQEQARLAAELVDVADRILEAVTRRVKTGGISPVEQSRAQVEAKTSEVELRKATQRVEIAKRQLAATWGSTSPAFTEALGTIDTTWPVPTLAELLKRIGDNPDLARWTTEMARRQASVELQKAGRIPDLGLGVGVRRFESDAGGFNAFVAELSLPLPIFDRNQGATNAAERRLEMGKEQRRAARVRAETLLGTTHQALTISEGEVASLRDEVLPEATSAYDTAQQAYTRGRMRLTDVLDTQRTLFALRSRYYDALAEYHRGKAEIERLIGAPLVEQSKVEE
ncbi:MAG: TolC family protein [Myxococcales bacterium]|nr:TolC family protein [Myxococcales bacterium]